MIDIEQHIDVIQAKLQSLQKQLVSEKKEHQQLKKDYRQQIEAGNMLQEKLEQVLKQNLILKASLSNLPAADQKELLKKINRYLKSIDSCISLMSK